MKVILLQDVKGVGKRFDEKTVSDGYATNFLLPKKLGILADKTGLARVNQLREMGESKKEAVEKVLEEKAAKREAKHLELAKFREKQRSSPSS